MVTTRQGSLGCLHFTSPACLLHDKHFSCKNQHKTTYLMSNGRVIRMDASINYSIKVNMAVHHSIIVLPSTYKTMLFNELRK